MISPDRVRILDRWDRSGLSAAAFAPTAGVSAFTLYSWRRQAKLAGTSRSASPFVEISARDGPPRAASRADGAAFELALPRGVTLRVPHGADLSELRRVVDALVA